MSSEAMFEYAEKTNVKELSEYFIKLAEGFRGKMLELQGKGQTITLSPEDKVKLEVKAKSRESEGELELEISWKHENVLLDEKLEVIPGLSDEAGS